MSIPLKTRFALFAPIFAMLHVPLLVTGVLIVLLLTSFYWITLIYITYRIIDHRSPHRGGWSHQYLRGFYNVLKSHFPCSLEIVDKSRFDKNSNYIFCVHPHGTISFTTLINFSTNTIKDLLELDSGVVVLPVFFWLPGIRELILSVGFSSSSSVNLNHVLKTRKGHVVVTVPGGLKEAELFATHSMIVRTSAVRGFAKLALQNGAQLVPVVNFGETDIFDLTTLDKLSPLQRIIKPIAEWVYGAILPNFQGQGHLGMIPFQKPLTSVVGSPIPSPQLANPSCDDVQKLYVIYCEALKELFHANRDRFGYHDVDMNICNK